MLSWRAPRAAVVRAGGHFLNDDVGKVSAVILQAIDGH
jgi:hypothetical protein